MCVCLCVGMCMLCPRRQKPEALSLPEALSSSEVEARGLESLWNCSYRWLQTILTCVLGTKLGSSARALHTLNHQTISLLIQTVFHVVCTHVCSTYINFRMYLQSNLFFIFQLSYTEIWKHLDLFLVNSKTILLLSLPFNSFGFLSVWSSLPVMTICRLSSSNTSYFNYLSHYVARLLKAMQFLVAV